MPRIDAMPDDARPVLICDLDGTILDVNSFPLWILHLIAGRLPNLGFRKRARLSLRTQSLLLRRKLGRLDHRQLMREVQSAWHEAVGPDGDPATDWIKGLSRRRVRPILRPVLCRIGSGHADAVLATAAAGEYAIALGRELGFSHVLATRVRLGIDDDLNHREEKLKRVLEFLAVQNWSDRPLILLTDHIDDLPLIDYCAAVAWFGSPAGMRQAQALSNRKKFICCHGLDETAMARALSELTAHACSAETASS
jgi:phosphoserine phosphatase